MPFFKVLSADKSSGKLVKGDTIGQITLEAKRKFNITANVKKNGDPIELMLVVVDGIEEDSLNGDEQPDGHGVERVKTNSPSPSYDDSDLRKISDRIPPYVLDHCIKGHYLMASGKRFIVHAVRDYMIEDLRTYSRGTATALCKMMCEKFPTSIHLNASAPTDTHDADNLEIERRQNRDALNRRNDEYGCVNHAPELPRTEAIETQEEKRKKLLDLFNKDAPADSDECESLLEDIYPTLRSLLIAVDRNLDAIMTDWPFLTESLSRMQHCSLLLGKNVIEEWNIRLALMCETMRVFFKSKMVRTKKEEELEMLCAEYKSASETLRSDEPKYQVAFPLLMLYFGEESSHVFRTIDVRSRHHVTLQS
ncbi:hypothetical protein QAD02_013657 [Eretmocerus hayati]|uniref:Uncharacterized protein n=1 Tax=Eretmocerus hayati TaxID=131215 RepID=A0ACC2P393_9HYME|nr:hypothetical protein QAD02_013657 [Eretmocerus hayati]